MIPDRIWAVLFSLIVLSISTVAPSAFSTTPSNTGHSSNSVHISSYKQYSIDQGLSQVTILDIEPDLNGFVWLATQAGLDRFDGYSFTNVNSPSTLQQWLPKGMVMDIELDETTGDMWFAARVGLYVLREDSGKFESYSTLLEANDDQETMAVHADDHGNIWIGTQRSVYVLEQDKQRLKSIWDGTQSLAVNDILMSKNNELWVATNQGVRRYDTDKQVWLPSLLSNTITSILHFDESGNAWVGSGGNGIYVFEQSLDGSYQLASHLNMSEGLVNSVINDIKTSQNGDIWIATTDGISIIRPYENSLEQQTFDISNLKSFDTATADATISNVLSLYLHPDGLVFAGTLGKGFTVADYGSTLFNKVAFDKITVPYSISVQNDELIWVASDYGLYQLNDKLKVEGAYFAKNHGNEPVISNILQDLKYSNIHNTLFVGSRVGLKKFNPNSRMIETMEFPPYLVYTISELPDGLLLLGTRSAGLYLYDPVKQTILHHWDIPLSFDIVNFSKNEWLIPTTNGLYLIDMESFDYKVFKHDPADSTSLPYNVVTWISKRSEGEFFVGTQTKGLQLMTFKAGEQKPVFTVLFEGTDIARLSIGAVVEDKNKDYWVSTTESIAKINNSLDEIIFYTKSDGVNASGYFIGAHDMQNNGRIFFAGVDGLTYFRPEELSNFTKAPNLQFTNIKTLDSEQKQMKESPLKFSYDDTNILTLPANNLVLTIEFAATEFNSPDKIRYAFMLEGFHKQWQYTSSRVRSASFTNLASGEYTFKVKATDRYQVWYETPLELKIKVKTAWYKTSMALGLWICLLCLLVIALYKWRMYSIYRREETLKKLVSEKTLDLENANEKLRQLSIRDPLTQTLNRRGFKECADRELAKYGRDHKSFSIILLDIDHFKNVNDTYGHEHGDKVLVEISKAIKHSLRKVDVMARWGGEEFIILLPDTELKDAVSVANKLRMMVANSKLTSIDSNIQVTFSAGVSEISAHKALDDCITHADNQLYKAKENGRNLVCSNTL